VAVELRRRELRDGGWSFGNYPQLGVEATCLAVLALAAEMYGAATRSMSRLLSLQRHDGSWPAFAGDQEGSWTTALAGLTLSRAESAPRPRERAVSWLLNIKGREADWLWRWKFKTTDRQTGINPDKFGWPWAPGTTSWVIPTAFAIIALKQFSACNRTEAADRRIRIGVEMLLDRACAGGGWNAGNRIAYGIRLAPHVEATAVALIALQDEPRTSLIEQSLDWLRQQAATLHAVSSLSWSILSLFLFGMPVHDLKARLAVQVDNPSLVRNNATLAVAALGLQCGETIHPFALIR